MALSAGLIHHSLNSIIPSLGPSSSRGGVPALSAFVNPFSGLSHVHHKAGALATGSDLTHGPRPKLEGSEFCFLHVRSIQHSSEVSKKLSGNLTLPWF